MANGLVGFGVPRRTSPLRGVQIEPNQDMRGMLLQGINTAAQTVIGLSQKHEERKAQDQRQKQAADLGKIQAVAGLLSKKLPADMKVKLWNTTLRPAFNALNTAPGSQVDDDALLPELTEWPDALDGFMKRAQALMTDKDLTVDQKLEAMRSLQVEAGTDANLAPMIEGFKERRAEQHAADVLRARELLGVVVGGQEPITAAVATEWAQLRARNPKAIAEAAKQVDEQGAIPQVGAPPRVAMGGQPAPPAQQMFSVRTPDGRELGPFPAEEAARVAVDTGGTASSHPVTEIAPEPTGPHPLAAPAAAPVAATPPAAAPATPEEHIADLDAKLRDLRTQQGRTRRVGDPKPADLNQRINQFQEERTRWIKERDQQGGDLTAGVRTWLRSKNVDPRKATGDQIADAIKETEGEPALALRIVREITFRRQNKNKTSDPDLAGLDQAELEKKFMSLSMLEQLLGAVSGQGGGQGGGGAPLRFDPNTQRIQ